MLKYHLKRSGFPRPEVKDGIHGRGLFVMEPIKEGRIIVEYTGNLVSGSKLVPMNRSFNYHGIHPDVQADVPSENAVIYHLVCWNQAMKVNHRCQLNSSLRESFIGINTIVWSRGKFGGNMEVRVC